MNAFTRRLAACLIAASLTLAISASSAAAAIPTATYSAVQTPRNSAAFPHLSYYGGRVLPNVKIDLIVWGSWSYDGAVPLNGVKSIASFFSGVTASRYMDWLNEYNTPSQRIGRGVLDGVINVRPPSYANGARVTDVQIGSALRSLIDAGRLPKPDANRLYVLFFRSGQVVVSPHGDSAHDFCAYHDTIPYGTTAAPFAVIPFEVGNRGCRPALTEFDNVTTVVSHEMMEAITDPAVGLRRLSWYDRNYGEIGDLCGFTSRPASVIGANGQHFVVQRLWSNRYNGCIVHA